jgi:DNA-binding transcriptional MerR regulator
MYSLSMDKGMMIGRLAERARVSVQTVRYYERRRLLRPAARRASGYRLYGVEAVRRLRFIKNSQTLGFTLEEIRSLLRLRAGGRASCGRVRRRAAAHARDVRARIARLRAMERALARLIRTCGRRGGAGCPILSALEEER